MSLVVRHLRIANRAIRLSAPADRIDAVLGNLAVFEAPISAPDVIVEVSTGGVPAEVACAPAPENDPASRVSYAEGPKGPRIVCNGLGIAEVPARGAIEICLVASARSDEPISELLTIPALSERLRRDGVTLVHGAVLRESKPGGRAWLIPAARGGGKSTLSLSLRGRGFTMLCDDRCWMFDDGDGPRVDPFPEAPRVGDRALFLVPPGLALGPRDPFTGKSSVPGLTPPRLAAPVALAGCLVPRLVDGAGGDIRPITGSDALAALVSQGLVATDPAATSATLARYASWLSSHPVFEIEVGDDPARAALSAVRLDGRRL